MSSSKQITLNLTESSLETIRVRTNVSARVNKILMRYAAIMAEAKSFKGYLMHPEIDTIRAAVQAFDSRGGGSVVSLRAQVANAVRFGGSEALAASMIEMPLARFIALLEWVEQQPVVVI